jgi:gliding motility-associated lipoprotein GldH
LINLKGAEEETRSVLETRDETTRTEIAIETRRINLIMRSKAALAFLLFLTLSVVGCTEVMFQESHPIPNKNWEQDSNVQFEVEVADTMSGYDFYIDLRNEGDYPYANIYMFVTTTFPSGKSARDTVECILADKSGRWLGSGLGDVLDNHILFKENVRFPNSGTYVFEFEHGMRTGSLTAIIDLGISLEKHRRK